MCLAPGVTVGLVTLIFHLIIGITHGGPVAVPDVSAYLSVPQWIYGGILPDDLAFHPGYGLLLAPWGWLSGEQLHSVALLTNGFLAACCVPLAVRFAVTLGANRQIQWLTASLVAVFSALSSGSRIAWPETLIIALLLGTALLIQREDWRRAGALVGLGLAVHPRLAVLVASLILLALTHRRTLVPVLQGLLPTSFATAGVLTVTGTWQFMRVSSATSFDNSSNAVATLMGQWLAFVGATGGLAALGLGSALAAIPRQRRCDMKAFLALSALGMFLLGGWTLAGSARVDTLLYGRYIAPWTLCLALVGLVALSKSQVGRFASSATVAVTGIALIVCLAAVSETFEPSRRIMTLELGILWSLFDNRLVPILTVAAALGIIGILSIKRGMLISTFLLIAVSVSSTWVNHQHLHKVGQISQGQVTAAKALPEATTCLAHDSSSKHYAMWLYRLELPAVQHQRLDLSAGSTPCGSYVIADIDALKSCEGAQMIIQEPRASWGLWQYPSEGCG
tara:strand:- start:676 stop:2199 length:1524 start_codon:yes stop_codon:yes gene_type:complete